MRQRLCFPFLALFLLLFATATQAEPTYMILEQDASGTTTVEALDNTFAADGIDPVLLHIYFNAPNDPAVAQVLWAATEGPLDWVIGADNEDFKFVEHAVIPEGGAIQYRIYLVSLDLEIQTLRHQRASADWKVDRSVFDQLPPGQYRVEARVQVPGRTEQIIKQNIKVLIDPENLNTPTIPEQPLPGDTDAKAYFIDKPVIYFNNSGDDIRFGVNNLPDNGDVLVIAWSEAEGKLVKEFPHALREGPWRITSDKLDVLPTGMHELQLLARSNGVLAKTVHRVLIVNPARPPQADQNPPPPAGGF